MQKDQAYHESAIQYNEGLAEFAEELAPKLEHAEVRKWCTSVGKQHRFHAKRHRSALNKLLVKQIPAPVESIVDGLDVHVSDENVEVEDSGTTEVTPEAEIATPETEISVPKEENPDEGNDSTPSVPTLEDGCSPFHNPQDENCEFYPKGNG